MHMQLANRQINKADVPYGMSGVLEKEKHLFKANAAHYTLKIILFFLGLWPKLFKGWISLIYPADKSLSRGYLTIILRNRAEYRMILNRRGRRPTWLKSGNILED